MNIPNIHINDFDILRELQRTKGGSVQKAYWKTYGIVVILKERRTSELGSGRDTLNEYKLLMSVNHPNIVKCLATFKHSRANSQQIVLEFCNQGDLSDLIQQHKDVGQPISEILILKYFKQLISALAYLHKQKIIHRDVKPLNCFIHNGCLKLGDFGVSTQLYNTIHARTFLGTPSYLSPEVVAGRPYSFSSDIWASGVLLFELLTLRTPFTGSINEIFEKIRCVNIGYHNDISEYWTVLLNKMLCDSSQRWSGDQILKYLEDCWSDEYHNDNEDLAFVVNEDIHLSPPKLILNEFQSPNRSRTISREVKTFQNGDSFSTEKRMLQDKGKTFITSTQGLQNQEHDPFGRKIVTVRHKHKKDNVLNQKQKVPVLHTVSSKNEVFTGDKRIQNIFEDFKPVEQMFHVPRDNIVLPVSTENELKQDSFIPKQVSLRNAIQPEAKSQIQKQKSNEIQVPLPKQGIVAKPIDVSLFVNDISAPNSKPVGTENLHQFYQHQKVDVVKDINNFQNIVSTNFLPKPKLPVKSPVNLNHLEDIEAIENAEIPFFMNFGARAQLLRLKQFNPSDH
eukprot:TRINITY_DN9565_c0_g1_i1.p1 TRINITY_DN9565_c0_g1~~TRINITY_DN9565_c0_g1_i1.p1  ORF type:complete len:565 (+),score=128.83 TRINITY_DN9565_c0_g1_i1:70-1764(+)